MTAAAVSTRTGTTVRCPLGGREVVSALKAAGRHDPPDITALTLRARDIRVTPEDNGFEFFVAFFASILVYGHKNHLLSCLWYRKKFVLRTPNEVVLFTGAQEESLRVFFTRFLIGHLAPNFDMDAHLGLMPPQALALSNGCP
jgi:hypothetical protein